MRKWQFTPVFLPGESPWTEEPGGLQSTGSQRVGHNRSDVACMHPVLKAYSQHTDLHHNWLNRVLHGCTVEEKIARARDLSRNTCKFLDYMHSFSAVQRSMHFFFPSYYISLNSIPHLQNGGHHSTSLMRKK